MEIVELKYPDIKNYVGGQYVSNGSGSIDIVSPLDGSVISRAPLSGINEVDAAVSAAQKAFTAWSSVPIKERVQVFYRYKVLLEKNQQAIPHPQSQKQ